jgi:hypothetical protein
MHQSFIVFLELFNYASYANLRLFIYFIWIDCIFITDNICLLLWDMLMWEKGPRWLDHNYDINYARNEDVDNFQKKSKIPVKIGLNCQIDVGLNFDSKIMNLTLINLWCNGIWLILSIILIDGQTSHE